MRLVFAGTPEPAVPSLQRILASHHEVIAVLTRPDAPVGRGKKMTPSPISVVATEAGIPVLKPRTLREPQILAELSDLAPDACPVVAYGSLVPPAALQIPRHGWINLHFSLLPAWRGAAPVQHGIWHGDDVAGASTFLLEEGLDTGPVFGTMVEHLGPRDTSGDVLTRLSVAGAELLLATLDAIESGEAAPVPQPADGISLAPKITVDDARVDWSQPAVAIDRQIRACTPAPGAWTTLREQRVKLLPVTITNLDRLDPGRIAQVGKNVWVVGTATSPLQLGDVQPAGKRPMPAADWFRGLQLVEAEVLT